MEFTESNRNTTNRNFSELGSVQQGIVLFATPPAVLTISQVFNVFPKHIFLNIKSKNKNKVAQLCELYGTVTLETTRNRKIFAISVKFPPKMLEMLGNAIADNLSKMLGKCWKDFRLPKFGRRILKPK